MAAEKELSESSRLNLRVISRDVTLAPQFRELAMKKLHAVTRLFHGPIEGELEVRKERGRYVVEISLKVSRYLLRGQERGKTIQIALERAVDKVDRQVRRHKERIIDRHRSRPNRVTESSPSEVQEPSLRVGRVKKYGMKPMSLEEAIITMDLLGHDFFVFVNSETKQVNVLYKRASGDLGLLEPGDDEE